MERLKQNLDQAIISVMELSTEGIFIEDTEGNILLCNEAGAAMFGYTPEELQQKVEELRTQLEEFYNTWVDPDMDGRKEAVCGRGQNCKIGKEAAGKMTFHPWVNVEYTK